jgi:hypothetical protein
MSSFHGVPVLVTKQVGKDDDDDEEEDDDDDDDDDDEEEGCVCTHSYDTGFAQWRKV